jgi:hypothetical protein
MDCTIITTTRSIPDPRPKSTVWWWHPRSIMALRAILHSGVLLETVEVVETEAGIAREVYGLFKLAETSSMMESGWPGPFFPL